MNKKLLLSIAVAASLSSSLPFAVSSCADDDAKDEKVEQEDKKDSSSTESDTVNKNRTEVYKPVTVNDDSYYLKFEIISPGEVRVNGLKDEWNGSKIDRSSFTSIVVPDTVYIGGNPFTIKSVGALGYGSIINEEVDHLTSVSLPNTLDTIRFGAFHNTGIDSIYIPNNVKYIGYEAFMNCKNLKKIHLPEQIMTISDRIFFGCSISDINWPSSIEYVGRAAFYNCFFERVSLPNVKTIEPSAFAGCSKLKSVQLPVNFNEINEYCFSGCSSLESVNLSDGVTIKDEAFAKCTSFKLKLPNNSNLEGNPFKDGLETLYIPVSAKYGGTAFNDMAVKSVSIENGIDSLPRFTGCYNLTTIDIPNSIISIPSECFKNCTSLATISIPNDVTLIDYGTFSGCSSLSSVSIPSGVTSIGTGAFSGCSSLSSVSIPSGVTSIGTSAFSGCSSLSSVSIPSGVTSIGTSAFSGCSSLSSVSISSGVTSIGASAFSGCSKADAIVYFTTKYDLTVFAGVKSLSVLNYPYVDLGLPSGLKWSTCYMGSTNPGEFGYPSTFEDASDKLAHMYGSTCRLPTKEEFEELIDGCQWSETEEDDNVVMLIGKSKTNGKQIVFRLCSYGPSSTCVSSTIDYDYQNYESHYYYFSERIATPRVEFSTSNSTYCCVRPVVD